MRSVIHVAFRHKHGFLGLRHPRKLTPTAAVMMPTICKYLQGFVAVQGCDKALTMRCCHWQASQTFLPASIGFPPAAWRFARKMAVTGIALGLLNSFCSGAAFLSNSLGAVLFTFY
jgi:hypothetical protein